MKTEKDFEDLLRSFNKHKVKYCIIGAYAVAFYSRPRYTKDLDVVIEPSIGNGQRIVRALIDFGFKSLGLTEKDFTEEGQVIQLGYEPIRTDILTSLPGIAFSKIWKNKKSGKYGRQKVYFIGLNELKESKRKSERKQDQADLEILPKS